MAEIPPKVLEEKPDSNSRFWVVIPAGGSGSRMGGAPKQYRQLGDRTVIEQTLVPFLNRNDIAGIVLCLSKHDSLGREIAAASPLCHVADAGSERSDSVLNGLAWLLDSDAGQLNAKLGFKPRSGAGSGPSNEPGDRASHRSTTRPSARPSAKASDWVLVHDAARPCLPEKDLQGLIDSCCENLSGGLLALPVRDTLKQSSDNKYANKTVDRAQLWQALTPQMFPLAQLRYALTYCSDNDLPVTDEASAIEQLGLRPQLVTGSALNLKVTWPGDLEIAERLLPLARNVSPKRIPSYP